ncbi:DUF2812 domain-containing protein [Aminipila sp.]|uniref:DUF2812 domain-containing protein n=1 Tax=Aminipila sp. TaxID=2060095 RepID=UPI002897908B|nr:DUF2812 domain-containing protein [Aminipila sp.]
MTEEADKQINWSNKLYMLRENELWLREQAQKGLLLKSFAKDYACFTEGEPQDIAYKIVILDVKKGENQIKIMEQQGFTFVESHFQYYIFRIDGKYRNIQPRLNEEMNKFARRWFNKQIFIRFSGTLIALICFFINLSIKRVKLFPDIVEIPAMIFVPVALIFSVLIIENIKEYRALDKNKKHYLVNEFYITRKICKKSISKYIMIIASIFLGAAAIKYFYVEPHQYSIAEVQKFMPIVLLQDIEKDEKISKELKVLQKYVSEDNYAEISHTFLAPNQYTADQENTYGENGNGMFIRFYEVNFKILAEPLARELLINNVFGITKGELKEIEYDGLDKVYYNDGYMDFISVCKGNKVMFISYDGDKPVSDILREVAEVL